MFNKYGYVPEERSLHHVDLSLVIAKNAFYLAGCCMREYDVLRQFRLKVQSFLARNLLPIIILIGKIVRQKYWAMSMLKREIPMEIRNIIGGVIEFKRNNFINDGVISP